MTVSGVIPQLRTTDLEASIRFYTTRLGLQLEFRYQDFYAGIRAGRQVFHLKLVDEPDPSIAFVDKGGHFHLYLETSDVAATADDFGAVLRGSWGSGCWCMYPRLAAAANQLGSQGRRAAMTKIARRRRAPGLLAFDRDEPVGWIAIAPRSEYRRIEASRATPRVDDVDVWVIPCITVRPRARGRGIALALIREAVAYAKKLGAPAVEAYPRAGSKRTKDDNAFFGTEPLFRRAGFRVIRKRTEARGNRVSRVTMRKIIGL